MSCLLQLHFSGCHVHLAELFLHLQVSNDLKLPVVFELLCPQSLFFFCHFALHLGFFALLLLLQFNLVDLVLAEAFEVVWLEPVVS